MILVNTTSLPAKAATSRLFPATDRIGTLVAKATFRMEPGGPQLERQDPYPIWTEDQETALGLLPRDDVPRRDPVFEVILLGAAYAQRVAPIAERSVALAVGDERRELLVFGDRVWEERDGTLRPSASLPFSRMPLTWTRAFGGACEVEVDEGAFLTVSDPRNVAGRGFDSRPAARDLAKALRSPAGYPVFEQIRRLPNIEDPAAPIRSWDDAPAPVCWGTVPPQSTLQAERCVARTDEAGALPIEMLESAYHRAHPMWVIAVPPAGATIALHGLSPDGELVSFRLPALRVFADYVVGARTGTCELAPQLLVLLPEDRRFYVVFRHSYTFAYPSGERSMRLRVEDGWWQSRAEEQ